MQKALTCTMIPMLVALLLVGISATPSVAQERQERIATQAAPAPSAPVAPLPTTPEPWWRRTTQGPWRFTFIGYGWLPDAPADIKLGRVEAHLPEDLGTLLDALQFGMFADIEVRKGRFGLFLSPILMFLEDSEHVQGPLQKHKVTLNEDLLLMEFGLSYELGRWQLWHQPEWLLPAPTLTVEPIVGALTLLDDIKVNIDPGGRNTKVDLDFITPLLGLNTVWDLTQRWNLRIGGYYGGFGADHVEETWNFFGTLGYRFQLRGVPTTVFAGYRWLHLHYQKVADIEVDVKGPIVGIAFEFDL